MTTRQTILVIMPIGSDAKYGAKQEVIGRSIERLGYKAEFPKYDPSDARFSVEQFSDQIAKSRGVLADLTGERPSCYFELGFAEALHCPVFLVAETGTVVHQSGYRHMTGFYSDLDQLGHAVTAGLQALMRSQAGSDQRQSG